MLKVNQTAEVIKEGHLDQFSHAGFSFPLKHDDWPEEFELHYDMQHKASLFTVESSTY